MFHAIEAQSYPKKLITILAVDGGSEDGTKEFVLSKGYRFLKNPKTEPVHAKFLGYLEAKTDYAMYLDHDEVLENPLSIEIKINLFQVNESVKAVIGSGYKTPQEVSFINNYINDFGDPFSAFRYWLSKMDTFFIPKMKLRFRKDYESDKGVIFNFKGARDLPIIELVAAGSVIDLNYFKSNFSKTLESADLLPHFFYMMIEQDGLLAITKNDPILHYSSESLFKYLNKIKWRIKNNIFFPHLAKAGFSGRDKYEGRFAQYKKFLFIPYSLLVLPALFDSFRLMIGRKNISYIIHLPLVVYTSTYIITYMLLKLLGYKPQLTSYDASKVITED